MRYDDAEKRPKIGRFIFCLALFWCECGWDCGLVRMQRKEAPGEKQFGSDIANFKRVFLSKLPLGKQHAAWHENCLAH